MVLVVVLITKFAHGAWIVVLAMPALFLLMKGIRRHYNRVAAELEPQRGGVTLPPRVLAIVLVSKLHAPTLRALAYARATRPTLLTAVTVSTDEDASDAQLVEWSERGISVPLKVLHSPYRDVTGPVLTSLPMSSRTPLPAATPSSKKSTSPVSKDQSTRSTGPTLKRYF